MLLASPSLIARPGLRPASVGRIPWWAPLFANGEQGLVFDYTDIATLFQDTAHTTPVTATGQTIGSIRDKVSGRYVVLTAGTATLQFDATLGLYYCATGITANYTGTGIVPPSCAGNNLVSLISVLPLTINTGTTIYMPNFIGPLASPSNGNCIAVRQNGSGGTANIEILQFGAGRGRTGPQQTGGPKVLVGRKNSGAGIGATAMDIWWGGAQVDNGSLPNQNPQGAITTLDYSIGGAGGVAMNIYRSAVVNRAITTGEIATVSVTGLQ